MHPFGEEEACSVQELFKFFCQSLCNGRWELALACLPRLVQNHASLGLDVAQLLEAVATQPHCFQGDCSYSVNCLAMMCLHELERLKGGTLEGPLRLLHHEVEFRLLLDSCSWQVPDVITQDLYQCFQQTHSLSGNEQLDPDVLLSKESKAFLQKIIDQDSWLGQAIISSLNTQTSHGTVYSPPLQQLFVDSILGHLTELRKNYNSDVPSHASYCKPAETRERLYSCLATLNLIAPAKTVDLDRLFLELYDACYGAESILSETRLLSCLLRKGNNFLVKRYCAVVDEENRKKIVLDNSTFAAVEGDSVYGDLPEGEKVVLALMAQPDRSRAWKELYFYCIANGKHFLELIVLAALQLVKRDDLVTLGQLLSGELEPLCRLVLLLGWDHCSTPEAARELLRTLHSNRVVRGDRLLANACNGLASQVDVLQWCIRKSSKHLSAEDLARNLHSQEQHSTLYQLHHLTDLLRLHEVEVFAVLLKPVVNSADQDPSSLLPTLDQQRNVALFHSFCAMKHAIGALCLKHFPSRQPSVSHESNTSRTVTNQCNSNPDIAQKDAGRTSSSVDGHTSEDDCPLPFHNVETKFNLSDCTVENRSSIEWHFEQCHTHVKQIAPQNLRLEVMENIFSLLFVTFEDLAGESVGAESDSEEYVEDGTFDQWTAESLESSVDILGCSSPDRDNRTSQTQAESKVPLQNRTLTNKSPTSNGASTETCAEVDAELSDASPSNPRQVKAALKRFALSANRKSGFVVDEFCTHGILCLLEECLETLKDEGCPAESALQLRDSVGSSIAADVFNHRLSRLSNYISEAQWRYKLIFANRFTGLHKGQDCAGELKRKRFKGKRSTKSQHKDWSEGIKETMNSDITTSATEGSSGGSERTGQSRLNERSLSRQESRIIPLMLTPPESLLTVCILQENYTQAQQVAAMFGLSSTPSLDELRFAEEYGVRVAELQRLEVQAKAVPLARRVPSPNEPLDVLQSIATAAAAGVAATSVMGSVEHLLSLVPDHFPLPPALAEAADGGGGGAPHRDAATLRRRLAECPPPALVAFDVACTRSTARKTCRTLLEVAERKLAGVTVEGRGKKGDLKGSSVTSVRGFPAFLKQVGKIINRTQPSGASVETDDLSAHFNLSVTELLLLPCPGPLSAEHMETLLMDRARADRMLLRISEAISTQSVQGDVLAHLMKHWAKAPSADGESVRHLVKQLLKVMDQQQALRDSTEPVPAYLHRLFDYLNGLSIIIIRSQGRDTDSSAEVKPRNTLVLLQKKPEDLLSQLLFEEHTLPCRLETLMKEWRPPLALNLKRVILDSCCRPLPLGGALHSAGNATLAALVEAFLHGAVGSCLPAQLELLPLSPGQKAAVMAESSQHVCQYSLTSTTLTYLKEVSPMLAMVACLAGDKRPGDKRKVKKNKKERPLELSLLCQELQHLLLNDFPVLHEYLSSTATLLGHSPTAVAEGQMKGEGGLGGCWPGCDCCRLLLCGPYDEQSAAVVLQALEEAMSAQDWPRALKLLDRFGREGAEWDRLRDGLLCCAAATDDEGWRFLLMMRGSEVRARVALWGLERWPAEHCLDLLELCISQGGTAPRIQEQLKLKHREITLYSTIQDFSILENCQSWTHIVKESIERPEHVLEALLQVQKFAVCREWAQLHSAGEASLLRIVEEEVAHLLEKGDAEQAQHILESLGEVETSQRVCERLLEQFRSVTASNFLSDYLSTHFLHSLSPEQGKLTQTIWIGTQLLLGLPQSVHVHYQELVRAPMLLLEQLLMNMRVDWALGAARTLRALLVGRLADFTSDDVDVLLSTYAGKALEFPYVSLRSRSRQDSDGSTLDSALSKFGSSPEAIKSASTASDGSSPDGSVGSIPGPRASTPVERRPSRTARADSWSPPSTVPAKKDWVPDEKARLCMACQQETFSMLNRRHHCRRCGRVVCTSCSSKTMVVDTYHSGPVRVCSQCYDFCQSEGPPEGGLPKEDDPEQEEAASDSSLQIMLQAVEENVWTLSLNTSVSIHTREEFYFEQAPSASLCISLLKMQSDTVQCCHQLINHCRKLSFTLNEPEVDSILVIGIMRHLLLNAKMMFSSAGHSHDLGVCDSYISRVGVLEILVSASYRLIPSLDDILRPSAVTRLRDQLIHDERYLLAIEVSTKCGLDTSGVWSAWGMACMRAGCLYSAREKFSRCLRAPLDPNQISMGSTVLLDIVQHLESTTTGSLSVDDVVTASLDELESLLKLEGSPAVAPHLPKAPPRDKRLEECLFYLQRYGTYLALVSFYGRHGRYHEALAFVLEKNCAEDVFVEGLLVPCLRKGQLDVLEKHVEELDPGLTRWSKYLIKACKCMRKRNMFNVLYRLQCFMKDNVRAAMSCINFFRKDARSYVELAARLDFLEKAKSHLAVELLDPQAKAPSGPAAGRMLSGSTSTPRHSVPFICKMTETQLSRNIRRIEMQVEVTRFLSHYDTARASPPPTLFDDNNVKGEVACLVMLSGGNVEVGFGVAFRVIQVFQLPALTVYTRVARCLVEERQLHKVETLLRCVSESGSADPSDCDSIALDTARAVAAADAEQPGTGQLQVIEERLIKKMKSNSAKIEAYLVCGKLRAAYLAAVKLPGTEAVPWVETIRKQAVELEQAVMVELCERWLSTHGDAAAAPPPLPRRSKS